MKNRPDIYYFKHIGDFNPPIDGNAILLTGEKNEEDCISVYFINNKGDLSKEEKFNIGSFADEYKLIMKNRQANGMVLLDGKQDQLDSLLFDLKFPYVRCIITLSEDARSIKVNSYGKKITEAHPLLSSYAPKNKDLLTLLREIKTDLDAMQSISFNKKDDTDVDIDDMIDLVLQSNNPFYSTVFKKIEYIGSRFKESPLTPQKKEILHDFRLYCGLHAKQGTERVDLLVAWVKDYSDRNDGIDPIAILRQHRRTNFSIFNPLKTDSIKLLEDFIGTEHDLELTLQGGLGRCNEQGKGW